MKPEEVLHVRRLPGGLAAGQVAVLTGKQLHDIPLLVKAGLLKPLGHPAPSSVKYFLATDVIEKANDAQWQHKATNCIYRHWRRENERRRRKNQTSILKPKE
jgi:hypothetical protein